LQRLAAAHLHQSWNARALGFSGRIIRPVATIPRNVERAFSKRRRAMAARTRSPGTKEHTD
jgi:hypothetical protein